MGREPDPDVVRWNLQDLEVCTLTNAGSCSSVTRYETDTATNGCIREGHNGTLTAYVENDKVISQLYQEELSRVAQTEASGLDNPSRLSIVSQELLRPEGKEKQGKASGSHEKCENNKDSGDIEGRKGARIENQRENSPECVTLLIDDDDSVRFVEIKIEDSCPLDGEVGKRLNQMVPVRHIPKINGELPTDDEQISDHDRLLLRIKLYGLVENKIPGDGNCQFRSLSDQFYRSPEHHKFVRRQVVKQLAHNRDMYEGYVPMAYDDYLKKMKRDGEWGDHVTLQAAADTYGVRIFVITSFKDTCYLEIMPHVQKSKRLICLSFWAEVHYNSIYPEGELPVAPETIKKKKKRWVS